VSTNLRAVLVERGIDAEVIDLGVPMTTAQAAADVLGVPLAAILKSIVVSGGNDQVAVVVLSGHLRIDLKAVQRELGWRELRFAKPAVVFERTGFPAGGTPPVGHARELPVIVDDRVFDLDEGFGGGGSPDLLLKIRPAELVRATRAKVAKVSCSGEVLDA
jgi:Cys-tRNA(Pro)/Cys-tRNA(Cys) deacylase